MKKSMMAFALVAAAVVLTGCQTTDNDLWRSDLHTKLAPAFFKPKYEVMKDKGIVEGKARKSVTWWIWTQESPDTFANDIGGDLSLDLSEAAVIKKAAFHNACVAAGADILLAPRYTVTQKTGPFWFYRDIEVVVKGVPAKLTGAEEVDVEWPAQPSGCCCK